MNRIVSTVILMALAATASLAAQTTATPAAESFLVMPKTLAAGSNAQKIRLEAASPDLFASSSSRTPRLSFGPGVTLVDGSFSLLSPSEAEASVNVKADAAGTVEVRLTFYSTDGKTAVRQERGTLGVSVQSSVTLGAPTGGSASGGEVKIRASDVPLVQANNDSPQSLGDIVLEGGVNGELVITPPAGTQFLQGVAPTVSVEQGNANLTNPRLDANLATFRVNVINGSYASIRVRIAGISIDASGFSRLGGTVGALSTSVAGLGLGPGVTGTSQPVLVVNGHTALAKLEGNQIVDTGIGNQPAETPANQDPATPAAGNTTVGSYVGGSSNVNTNRRNNNRNITQDALARERAAMQAARNQAVQQLGAQAGSGLPQRPQVRQWQQPSANERRTPPPPQGNQPPSEAGASGGAGRTDGNVRQLGTARANPSDAAAVEIDEPPTFFGGSDDPASLDSHTSARDEPDYRKGPVTPLAASRRLYFTDRNYRPLAGVVLQQGPAGERESRVWVVLEREPVAAEEAQTVNVLLRIGANYREIKLTETGAGTGVFRCDPAGVDVAMIGSLAGR